MPKEPKYIQEIRDKLNARQQKFVHNLVEKGMSAAEAYREAGYSPEGDRVGASNLLTNINVKKLRNYLLRKASTKAVLTRSRKRELLACHAETAEPGDSIRAIQEDNKMTGEHEPQKVEINDLGELLAMIRRGDDE